MAESKQRNNNPISPKEIYGCENVIGLSGELKWENTWPARISFDHYVIQTDDGNKEEVLTAEMFAKQFELQTEKIKEISLEQFRKDGKKCFQGRVFVFLDGCKRQKNNWDNKLFFNRDTIGKALLLEYDLFWKLYKEYYDEEIYKEIIKDQYKPELSIAEKSYYGLPEIKNRALIIERYNAEHGEDFYVVKLNTMLGGFYSDNVDWKRDFGNSEWFFISESRCSYDGPDFSKDYCIIKNQRGDKEYFFKVKKADESEDISLAEKKFEKCEDERNIKYSKKRCQVMLDNEITEKLTRMFFHHFLYTIPRYGNPLNMEYEQLHYLLRDLCNCLPDNCDKQWIKDWVLDRIARDKALNITDDPLFAMAKKEDDRTEQFDIVRDFYLEKDIQTGDFRKISDELKNLFLTISQNPLTILTGKAGQGKRTLCDKLGEGLGFESEDLCENRYREITATENWEDGFSFERRLQEDIRYSFGMLEYLDYEADQKGQDCPVLPYILCIKDANIVPVKKYLEKFLVMIKKWYRTKDSQPFGNTGYRIPKNFRILLVMDEDSESTLPDEILQLASVVEVYNPKALVEEINNKGIVFSDYFGANIPKFGEETFKEEMWGNSGTLEDSDEKIIYRNLCRMIERTIRVNKKTINVHSVRTEHAVSRHWYCEKGLLKGEEKAGKPGQYYPEKIVVDENLINDNITPSSMALDYALSQRVISYITHIKGDVTINDPSILFELMLKNRLFICSELLKDAIERERIVISDELSEESNNEFIIKKCDRVYENLVKESKYRDLSILFNDKNNDELPEEAEELIVQLCKNINYFRDSNKYTRNVIVNMMISLSQGFLTIFSGKPGCGKTSVCRILGGVLGLSDYSENGKSFYMEGQYENAFKSFEDLRKEPVNPSRYFEVSTERGWTSKRDFIGYYNPLTEQFDKSNAMLYNAFLVMDHQAKTIKEKASGETTGEDMLPCFILLDEANLSPMEHYWADFMNLCEAWSENNSIDLGGGRVFYLPEALHFIATINNDHTTTVLSPRLIDRATVIDLPERANGAENLEKEEPVISPIPWPVLKGVFGYDKDDRTAEAEFKSKSETISNTGKTPAEIYYEIKEFVKTRFMVSISPRTDIAVAKYYLKASTLFSEESYSVCEGLLNILSQSRDDLRQIWEGESSDKIRIILKYAFCQGNEELMKQAEEEAGEEINYETIECGKEVQALDYAIAQRVLPKITELNSEEALYDLLGLMKTLSDYKLFKSAGIVADIADRGCDNGFYNYFR